MTGRKVARVAWLFFLISGCGGGSSAPPMASDFCDQLATAECSKVQCAGQIPEPCKTNRKALCLARAADATAGNTRFFTPANMADCINRSRAAYSSTTPIPPKTLADIDRACNYVFQGKKMQLSDACTTRYECAGTTNGTIVCDMGVCATNSAPKSVGMPCGGNPGDICATGSYCTPNASNVKLCTAKGASGDACDASKPCIESLRCANGTCGDRVAVGQHCGSDDDCAAAGPYCDPYGGFICDPGLSFSTSSPSCNAFTAGTAAGGAGGGSAGGTSGGSAGTGGGSAGTGGGSGGTTGGGGVGGLGGLGGLGGVIGGGGTGGSNQDAATGN